MKEYNFLLRFQLPSTEVDPDSVMDKLGEAGCTDALVGMGQPGRIALDFTRQSNSALEAILSAVANVKRAIPEAQLIEAGPDFVGLSDVAEVAGVSRQNIRKLMLGHIADFPPPLHEGNPSIWHLVNVLVWLESRNLYKPAEELIETAQAAMTINVAKEERQLPSRISKEVISCLT